MSGDSGKYISTVEDAIAKADIFHRQGTKYLHIINPLTATHDVENSANPTGAVVVPTISLATTFKQSEPGIPTQMNDPSSFGKGYEYSRTGREIVMYIRYVSFSSSLTLYSFYVGNPTRGVFERAVAAAEKAKHWYVHVLYI